MSETQGPLPIRDALSKLLTALEAEPRLAAELDRSKREFFSANPTAITDPKTAEIAALRWAEWYLCERESEFLGAIPLLVAESRLGISCPVPTESRVGVYLVQRGGKQPTVRDLSSRESEALEIAMVPEPLEVGDALIGRLFASDDGVHYIPSAAVSIVSASPRFALAFQQDIKALAIERRLTQAELEHLLFRQQAPGGDAVDDAPLPLERAEAAFAKVLATAGKVDLSVTEISDALRQSERPGSVVESVLEELAFETDVDLELSRRALLDLVASVAAGGSRALDDESDEDELDEGGVFQTPGAGSSQTPESPRNDAPQDDALRDNDRPTAPRQQAGKSETLEPSSPTREMAGDSAAGDSDADDSDGTLGAKIANRIERGLSSNESMDALFADVEEMLGEKIDDPEDDGAGIVGDLLQSGALDDVTIGGGGEESPTGSARASLLPGDGDGDLDPLVREYLWECDVDPEDTARLDAFVAMQRVAPVPLTDLDAIGSDECLRFLMLAWLDQPTRTGAGEVTARLQALQRFFEWAVETQEMDRLEVLETTKREFVDHIERLADASAALMAAPSSGPTPAGAGEAFEGPSPDLYVIVEVDDTAASVRALSETASAKAIRVPQSGSAQEWAALRSEDLVLGRLAAGGQHFDGIAIVLPRRLQRLLG